MSGGCEFAWTSDGFGWILPGGGAVMSVNGDTGPAVLLDAGDIPSTGPSTVQADLDLLKPITSQAELEARYPNVAGVHTIDLPTEVASPGGADIVLDPGRSIFGLFPGSLYSHGAFVTIRGDVAGPLLWGEMPNKNLRIDNANAAGNDFNFESLFGNNYVIEVIDSIGENAGSISNVLAGMNIKTAVVTAPSATAIGMTIDGTIGAIFFLASAVFAPGGAPWTGFSILATCTVVSAIGWDNGTLLTAFAGDAFLFVDPAATLPTGPLPTSKRGIRVTGSDIIDVSGTAPGSLFAPGGLDQTDIRIYSGSNPNGPGSRFLGDAILDVDGGAAANLSHAAFPADTLLVAPPTNGAGADLILQSVSQRHTLFVDSAVPPYRWRLRYDGANENLIGQDSWGGQFQRTGGSASTVQGFIQRKSLSGSGSAKKITVDLGPAGAAPDGTYSVIINGTPFDEISVAQSFATVSANLQATINLGAEPVLTAVSDAAEAFVVDSTTGAEFTFSSSGPAQIDLWETLLESKGVIGSLSTRPGVIGGDLPTTLNVGDETRVVVGSDTPATDTEILLMKLRQQGTVS